MSDIRDFSHIKNFPGTLDNEFDLILRRFDDLQKIPAPLFAVALLIIAALAGYGRWEFSIGLWGFFLSDWGLLALLPRAGRSYGPPQPPALILAVLRVPFALLPIPIALGFQAIGTLLVIYGFWIEPHRLTLTRQQLTSAKLPESFKLNVLHIGDLHVERITQREKELNRLIAELNPDLILFSGDFLNLSYIEDPTAIDHARQIIAGWKAQLGAYVVSGSEAVDLDHIFPTVIADLPVTWLRHDVIYLQKDGVEFNVTGLSCSHRPFRDAPLLEELSRQKRPGFSILLYHSPDLAPNAAQMGYDLQLSGHTHGGQVCLPLYGPLFTASLYGRQFRSGRYALKDMTLYITRGVGLEGKAAPRIRFLCPPEVILWEITGSTQSN